MLEGWYHILNVRHCLRGQKAGSEELSLQAGKLVASFTPCRNRCPDNVGGGHRGRGACGRLCDRGLRSTRRC